MSRAVSARFQTLCGCTRFEMVESPAPREFRVAVQADEDGPTFYRVFQLRSLRPVDVPVEADYVEVID